MPSDVSSDERSDLIKLTRIAVVVDDAPGCERLLRSLSARGYVVSLFDSAARWLEAHREEPFDLVILGLAASGGGAGMGGAGMGGAGMGGAGMGGSGMDSLSACRVFKARSEGFVPVLLLSSRDGLEARIDATRAGADDFVARPIVEDEVLTRVTSLLRIKQSFDELRASRDRFAGLAMLDPLTGLYDAKHLKRRLAEEWKRAERHHEPFAVAALDIDRLGAVNERHGQEGGNSVLREVGSRLARSVRETDLVARVSSDEFIVLLPSTRAAGALVVVERMRHAIVSRRVDLGAHTIEVTISAGLALYPSRGVSSKTTLLEAAQAALVRAKDEGRDRSCVAQEFFYVVRDGEG